MAKIEGSTPFKMKGNAKEYPAKYDGLEIPIPLPVAGETPEETWNNILDFCQDRDHVAALHTFNKALRLDSQKTVKEAAADGSADEARLAEVAQNFRATRVTYGQGGTRKGSAKAKVAAAASTVDSAIEALEATATNLKGAAKAAVEEQIATLRERRAALGI